MFSNEIWCEHFSFNKKKIKLKKYIPFSAIQWRVEATLHQYSGAGALWSHCDSVPSMALALEAFWAIIHHSVWLGLQRLSGP